MSGQSNVWRTLHWPEADAGGGVFVTAGFRHIRGCAPFERATSVDYLSSTPPVRTASFSPRRSGASMRRVQGRARRRGRKTIRLLALVADYRCRVAAARRPKPDASIRVAVEDRRCAPTCVTATSAFWETDGQPTISPLPPVGGENQPFDRRPPRHSSRQPSSSRCFHFEFTAATHR